MGAGFPLLARTDARSVPELHRGIGRLVAGATLGGVAGVIATGFVVLPRAGVPGAAAFAAVANLGAAWPLLLAACHAGLAGAGACGRHPALALARPPGGR